MRWILSLLPVALLLSACVNPQSPAPIVERAIPGPGQTTATVNPTPVLPEGRSKSADTYTVKKGDTLYRIAFEHDLSFRDLAAWNNLANPSDIKVDQVLHLKAPAEQANGVEVRPLNDADSGAKSLAIASPVPAEANAQAYPKAVKLPYSKKNIDNLASLADGSASSRPSPEASKPKAAPAEKKRTQEKPAANGAAGAKTANGATPAWVAPTSGKLLKAFSEESKGVDIGGKIGQAVVAAEAGKVVYAGTGLRGYGKMVIIKHDNAFLSAYAHNNKLLVKEGGVVKKGEKIAEMGNTDTDRVKLHFEIRKFGKPVDPTKFITVKDHE